MNIEVLINAALATIFLFLIGRLAAGFIEQRYRQRRLRTLVNDECLKRLKELSFDYYHLRDAQLSMAESEYTGKMLMIYMRSVVLLSLASWSREASVRVSSFADVVKQQLDMQMNNGAQKNED